RFLGCAYGGVSHSSWFWRMMSTYRVHARFDGLSFPEIPMVSPLRLEGVLVWGPGHREEQRYASSILPRPAEAVPDRLRGRTAGRAQRLWAATAPRHRGACRRRPRHLARHG